MVDARYEAPYGLKSDIAPSPKTAISDHLTGGSHSALSSIWSNLYATHTNIDLLREQPAGRAEVLIFSGSVDAVGRHRSQLDRREIVMRQVTCQCGAVYERTEQKVIFRDQDRFRCHICGWEIESWNDSRIPIYKLVKRPETDTD